MLVKFAELSKTEDKIPSLIDCEYRDFVDGKLTDVIVLNHIIERGYITILPNLRTGIVQIVFRFLLIFNQLLRFSITTHPLR